MEYTVEVLKYPTEEDLKWCKTCTLNTVGKKAINGPSEDWIKKLVEAEHSPARELIFGIKMVIPYWVSVHFVRHHIGVNHYVQSQRDDRNKNDIPRAEKPQGEMVSHIMSINAQELIFMAHKRLCSQASLETRTVMKLICWEVIKVAPYMKDVLVPLCEYRGGLCTEFNPCGRNKQVKKVIDILEEENKTMKEYDRNRVLLAAVKIRDAVDEQGEADVSVNTLENWGVHTNKELCDAIDILINDTSDLYYLRASKAIDNDGNAYIKKTIYAKLGD